MKMRFVSLIVAAMLMIVGTGAFAERTITVQGVGSVKVDADHVGVSMGVREVAQDVMDAQNAVNAKIDAVVEALREMGDVVENVSTNGISLYPNYNYNEDVEQIIGYTAYNSVYVTLTDASTVGQCIDAAFEAGVNSLDYVDFTAVDTSEASDKALTLAVESASHKAQVLADAAGVQLGEILRMDDGYNMSYDYNAAYAKTEEDAGGMGTQVLPARQMVTANVVITFAIIEPDAQ